MVQCTVAASFPEVKTVEQVAVCGLEYHLFASVSLSSELLPCCPHKGTAFPIAQHLPCPLVPSGHALATGKVLWLAPATGSAPVDISHSAPCIPFAR